MRLSPTLLALLTALLSKPAFANDPIPQSVLDSQGLRPFVLASRPLWEFGIPSKGLCPSRTAPCYPDTAVDPSNGTPNAGADGAPWPDANKGCRFPSADGKAGGFRALACCGLY
jgi:hypothetical protein